MGPCHSQERPGVCSGCLASTRPGAMSAFREAWAVAVPLVLVPLSGVNTVNTGARFLVTGLSFLPGLTVVRGC